MEIVVDAYDEVERAMGWYYYLEDKLHFPFKAKCVAKREISPLMVGDKVEVVKMALEDFWASYSLAVRGLNEYQGHEVDRPQ